MTNEMQTVMWTNCHGSPPFLLFCAWGVALLTALMTLPLAVGLLRRGRSVCQVVAVNRVVAFAAGILCLCSILGQLNWVLLTGGTVAPTGAQAELMALGLSRVLNQLSISVLVCGFNALIALGLNQKWTEPGVRCDRT